MAITAPAITGAGATTTNTSSEDQFFKSPVTTGRCSTLRLRNRTGGVSARIRIPELHGAAGYALVPSDGLWYEFRVMNGELTSAYVKADSSGTVTFDWYPSAVTKGP